MRHVLAVISLAAAVGVMTAPAQASGMFTRGDGDLGNGEKIFKEGKGDVPACLTCHGEDGSGNDQMGTPAIAGQGFSFLLKQLEDFATDKRQDTTMFVMNANAKGLTPQDRRDVATFLASGHGNGFRGSDLEELKKAGSIEIGIVYKGKALVEYGSPMRNDGFPKELGSRGPGAPACKSCHDFAGRGAPPIYPKIGQQRYVYLVNQLKKWRDGSRANDPKGQMQAVAQKLSDSDIYNVAAYLTGAGPLSPGNTRTPYDH